MLRFPFRRGLVAASLLAGLSAFAAGDGHAVPSSTTAAPAVPPEFPEVLTREEIAAFALPGNDARREHLEKSLASRGLKPAGQPVKPRLRFLSQDPRKNGGNVIVTLGPEEAATEIVVGAHFDTLESKKGTLDGLIDNAVAVAILIRAAESLKEDAFRRRIRFVFFDMEEIGLLGSRQYVRQTQPETIAAMVNLDVVGLKGPVVYGSCRFDLSRPLCDVLREVAAAVPVDAVQTRDFPGTDFIPFRDRGVPFLQLSTLPEDAARIAENWREGDSVAHIFRHIHSPRDNITAVDLPTVNAVHALLVRFIRELDRRLPVEPREPPPKEQPKPGMPENPTAPAAPAVPVA